MNPIELSIVIPVYNEEENIPLIIKEFEKYTDDYYFEVIFAADEGSSEKTKQLIKESAEKYHFINYLIASEKGYGASIFAGLKTIKGEFICWTHADLQTDPQDVLKALDIIKKQENPEKTYVKGQRYGRPLSDRFFTFGMSIYESIILKSKLYDINAQPNLFHRSFLNIMKDPPTDFLLDLYVYYIAKTNNYKIIKFPVYFGTRVHGHSAWNFGFKSRVKLIKRTINFSKKLKKRLVDSTHDL